MSDASNSTADPFGSDPTNAHGGLYKAIGLSLAVASGLFIGSSFVFKKKGLIESMGRSGCEAGEGYAYLKSFMWWSGMILMIVGELCNFVAYSFAAAILVTPLGALSVVISAVLSSIFLKERLSFQGKMGCLQCIFGAVIIVLHAPEEGASDTSIDTFKRLMLSVGFLVYAGIAVVVSLFLVFYCGPRWGKKNMLVYIGVCSWIGSLSVVFTQGLGAAIVHSITISNQFTNWFLYLVLVLTAVTLIIEIVYLNKALNLFNTALVTPTYYVLFTTLTIVSSIVLYRGFDASPVDIVSCVFGFLVICSGVALLHNSRSDASVDDTSSVDSRRRRSVLQMFENEKMMCEDQESVGTRDPGPGDVLARPFTGTNRYAVTSRRSLTLSRSSRTFDEMSEKELMSPVSPLPPDMRSASFEIQPIDPPPPSRRAQAVLEPWHSLRSSFRRPDALDEDDDRAGLVSHPH